MRKNLKRYVHKTDVQYENFIVVKVSKQLVGGDRDILYVSVYCQPSGSPCYRMNASDCVVNDVMHCCVELQEKYGD